MIPKSGDRFSEKDHAQAKAQRNAGPIGTMRLTPRPDYCFGAGLSDIGGGAAFLAAARGGLLFLVAEAGAELVGGALSGAAVCDCGGGGLGGGSAVMMLTGGIDCDEGNCTFGPGGVIGPLEPL